MKMNLGTSDRMIRVFVAALLAALAYAQIVAGITGVVMYIAAAVLALTSMLGYCPMYTLFRIDTAHAHA